MSLTSTKLKPQIFAEGFWYNKFLMSKKELPQAQPSWPEELPPAYSASSSSAEPINRPVARSIPGLPVVPFGAYLPKGSTLSKDSSTVSLTDPALCSSPQALQKWITDQISLLPIPEIRIIGSHRLGGGTEVDFDVRLNMLRYFLPEDRNQDLSPTRVFVTTANKSPVSLTASSSDISRVAVQFARNKSARKSLHITRTLSNWDTDLLTGRIHAHVLSLNYKGTISITFPASHKRVVLKPDTSFASAIRNTFFGGTEENRVEIETIWPYANRVGGESEEECSLERICLVRSEEGWWRDWKSVVSQAIMEKRKGWVGLDDMMEYAIRPVRDFSAPKSWGDN